MQFAVRQEAIFSIGAAYPQSQMSFFQIGSSLFPRQYAVPNLVKTTCANGPFLGGHKERFDETINFASGLASSLPEQIPIRLDRVNLL